MSITNWLIRRAQKRAPDFIIGGADRPYLRRWWLIPRNPILNVYLHQFLRSDDDRAEHDHPWANISVLLRGCYLEWRNGMSSWRFSGDVVVRPSGAIAHRVELVNNQPCWTLFITGPRYREWGFWCGERWVHWRDFTSPNDKGAIGPGCGA